MSKSSSPVSSAARCVPVILSGGMGTRLWPMSRGNYPKQFLNLSTPEHSLIQETVLRVRNRDRFTAPILVCNQDHRFLVAEKLQQIQVKDATILLEPVGRNTAPALAAAAHLAVEMYGEEALLLVLPSDHIIRDKAAFLHAANEAMKVAAEGYLTTFGITPHAPETGYGYIRKGKPISKSEGFRVDQFVEKPDVKKAKQYLDSGEYLWNSGMFCLPAAFFIQELKKYQPDMASLSEKALTNAKREEDFIRLNELVFSSIKGDSIDYAVMEHTNKAAIVPVECGWTDAGSFDALWEVQEKDESGNVVHGETHLLDTQDCYISCVDGVRVATLGLKNLVIISTKDCLMVADKSRAQDVKHLVDKVKKTHPDLVEQYRQIYRPWGHYDSIDNGDRHQVKRIVVKPGASLSLQMHYHRAEHWIVVSGTAIVQREEKEEILSENQSVYIPYGCKHRLRNPGKVPLELIEVQSGSYLGEDDIVRFEDTYGRVADAR
jgi:mannose-1-phosphate guanylyltransferase/mannose-6-phosphate isomerase